jgi:hypothetical protein
MIRKFVEILIIEVYEAQSKAGDIKGGNGDFFMLGACRNKAWKFQPKIEGRRIIVRA